MWTNRRFHAFCVKLARSKPKTLAMKLYTAYLKSLFLPQLTHHLRTWLSISKAMIIWLWFTLALDPLHWSPESWIITLINWTSWAFSLEMTPCSSHLLLMIKWPTPITRSLKFSKAYNYCFLNCRLLGSMKIGPNLCSPLQKISPSFSATCLHSWLQFAVL